MTHYGIRLGSAGRWLCDANGRVYSSTSRAVMQAQLEQTGPYFDDLELQIQPFAADPIDDRTLELGKLPAVASMTPRQKLRAALHAAGDLDVDAAVMYAAPGVALTLCDLLQILTDLDRLDPPAAAS